MLAYDGQRSTTDSGAMAPSLVIDGLRPQSLQRRRRPVGSFHGNARATMASWSSDGGSTYVVARRRRPRRVPRVDCRRRQRRSVPRRDGVLLRHDLLHLRSHRMQRPAHGVDMQRDPERPHVPVIAPHARHRVPVDDTEVQLLRARRPPVRQLQRRRLEHRIRADSLPVRLSQAWRSGECAGRTKQRADPAPARERARATPRADRAAVAVRRGLPPCGYSVLAAPQPLPRGHGREPLLRVDRSARP